MPNGNVQCNAKPIEACYGTLCGVVIREGGKSRPGTMDEIEARFGPAALDAVMSSEGRFVPLGVPTMTADEAALIVAAHGDYEGGEGTPEQYDRLIADVRAMRIDNRVATIGDGGRAA